MKHIKINNNLIILVSIIIGVISFFSGDNIVKAGIVTQIKATVHYRMESPSGCGEGSDCDFSSRYVTLGGTRFDQNCGNDHCDWEETKVVQPIALDSTIYAYCNESDSFLAGDDDRAQCNSQKIFTTFGDMYAQTTNYAYRTDNVRTCAINDLLGDGNGGCYIQYVNVSNVVPSNDPSVGVTSSNTSGDTNADKIQRDFDFSWPNPDGQTVTYYWCIRPNIVKAGGYDASSCEGNGYFDISSTTATNLTVVDIPSGSWSIHVTPKDASTRARHYQTTFSILAPRYEWLGTTEFPTNDGVEWTDATLGTAANQNDGISGTEYTFKIIYFSTDDAAIGATNMPQTASLEIDYDNDGTADLTNALIASGDKVGNSCTSVANTKLGYQNGQAFCWKGNINYATSAQKGAWRYRFNFRSQSNTINGVLIGNNTTTSSWNSFSVAPAELQWVNSPTLGLDRTNTLEQPILGRWQAAASGLTESTFATQEALRKIKFQVVYRFTDAATVNPVVTGITSNADSHGIGGSPACNAYPRVEFVYDEDKPDTSPDVDYCIALGVKTAGSNIYEAVFTSGKDSAYDVVIPFDNTKEPNIANTNTRNYRVKKYRYRFRFNGVGSPFATLAPDALKDIRSGGTGVTANDDIIQFDTINNSYYKANRILFVEKNALIFRYFGGAAYDTDATLTGKGVSPNCAYGGFMTSRLSFDPTTGKPAVCSSDADTPATLSPPWNFQVQVIDPDNIGPSIIQVTDNIKTSAVDATIITATDNKPYMVLGLDVNDDTNFTANYNGVNEKFVMACSGASWAAGYNCTATIPAGKLRYRSIGNPSYDGKIQYGFIYRNKYNTNSSNSLVAPPAPYVRHIFTGLIGDPDPMLLTNGGTHLEDSSAPSIRIINNAPILIFDTSSTASAHANSCIAVGNFSGSGVSPLNAAATNCRKGGMDYLFRVMYYDYDGFLPGQGSWSQVDTNFTPSALGSSYLSIDLDNDAGNYLTANPYPWADVTFEDSGENFTMVGIPSTQVSTSNGSEAGITNGATICATNNNCLGQVYEYYVPKVYFNLGDGNNEYIFTFSDDSGVAAIASSLNGGNEIATRTLGVINNEPYLESCGANFTNYDLKVGPDVNGDAAEHNTQVGAYNNDYVHPQDRNGAAGSNKEFISGVYYSADNKYATDNSINAGSTQDASFANDNFIFCVRYIDEDRFAPTTANSIVSIDLVGNGVYQDIPLCKLGNTKTDAISLCGISYNPTAGVDNDTFIDTDAKGSGVVNGDLNGIVYVAQLALPTAIYAGDGLTKFDFRNVVTGKGFQDGISGLMPASIQNIQVLNVTPYVSPLYKFYNFPGGSPKLVFAFPSGGDSNPDFGPTDNFYCMKVGNCPSSSVGQGTTWDTNKQAINYWQTFMKKNAGGLTFTSTATTDSGLHNNQKYFGGVANVSNCLSVPSFDTVHTIRANTSGSPAIPNGALAGITCGGGPKATYNTNATNLVAAFTPSTAKNPTELNVESLTSFTYARPGATIINSVITGALPSTEIEPYFYGLTGSIFNFELMWWSPLSSTRPAEASVVIDYNFDGVYSVEERTYLIQNNSIQSANGTVGSNRKCEQDLGLVGEFGASKTEHCIPLRFLSNIKPNELNITEGSLIRYHYAFNLKDAGNFPPSRHPLTSDNTREIFVNAQASLTNTPIMNTANFVTPSDPWILVKYRKPPQLQQVEGKPIVEKIKQPDGSFNFRFWIRYSNPYLIPPSCQPIFTNAASVCNTGTAGHSHLRVDVNANGTYDTTERFKLRTVETNFATKGTGLNTSKDRFEFDGYVDFVYPHPDIEPNGLKIKFNEKVTLKYEFDFAEYYIDGSGNDQGLAASPLPGTFKLEEGKEPIVVRNNYQHPNNPNAYPVKILVGNLTPAGQILQGSYSIRVFSASGKMVFDNNGNWLNQNLGDSTQEAHVWRLVSNSGETVGSGVYLVLVNRVVDGTPEAPYTKKVVVVRGSNKFSWE